MSSKYPVLSSEEVVKHLLDNGFKFISQKGSHRKYRRADFVVIVPMHSEIAKGTLISIIKQSGLSLEDFLTQ